MMQHFPYIMQQYRIVVKKLFSYNEGNGGKAFGRVSRLNEIMGGYIYA